MTKIEQLGALIDAARAGADRCGDSARAGLYAVKLKNEELRAIITLISRMRSALQLVTEHYKLPNSSAAVDFDRWNEVE